MYLDDIMVYSKTFDEHLDRLQEVFGRLGEAGLKLKPNKCQLFRHSVPYLGHVISAEGVKTDPEKTKTVAEWPMPLNVKWNTINNMYTDRPLHLAHKCYDNKKQLYT